VGAPRALMVPSGAPGNGPDPEVSRRASRRRFTAKYKLEILRKVDECGPGQIGALLRREGLYYSILTEWRRQRERGELEGLTPRRRGRKSTRKHDPLVEENCRLRRELERTQKRLKKAEIIIEVQKKISDMLGIAQPPEETIEDD
jgi:transposase